MEKVDWKKINQNIKMQKSLIKNGKTPHIRDMARNQLKLLKQKVKQI